MILLTIEQAAKRAQFCRNTIKKAIHDGELRHGRFGRLVRIKESDLDEWVERKIVGTMQSKRRPSMADTEIQVTEKIVIGHR